MEENYVDFERIFMNILFLGDIVARVGREAVLNNLRSLKKQYHIDLTVANVENTAHGKGVTKQIINQFQDAGIDIMTLGNHAFSKGQFLFEIDYYDNVLRPANMEPLHYGNVVVDRIVNGIRVAVVNLLGEVFMNGCTESPVQAMKKLLSKIKADVILVDLHGEATSEKEMFMYYFADRLTAVIGTHTHVQTADERIYQGCAYITDAGMCGSFESILGRDIQEVINRTVYHQKTRYTPSSEPAIICGCVIHIDEDTKRADKIERIQIRP